MKHATLITVLTLAASASTAVLAARGESDAGSVPGAVRLRMGMGGAARSALEGHDAAYAMGVVTADLEVGDFFAGAKGLHFDWSGSRGFVEPTGGRDPWRQLYQLQVGWSRNGAINERLRYTTLLGISSAFESQPEDSLAAFGAAYGLYRLNPRWMLSFGLFGTRHQQIETDYDLVPVLGLLWNAEAAEGLSLELGLPRTEATWRWRGGTHLALALDYASPESGVYRLDDDSPVRSGGYAELAAATVALRLETPLPGDFNLQAAVSHGLFRELTLYDADGGRDRTYEIEKQFGAMLALERTF